MYISLRHVSGSSLFPKSSKKIINYTVALWLIVAQAIAYLLYYNPIDMNAYAICTDLENIIPSISRYGSSSKHPEVMKFIAIFFILSWLPILGIFYRKVPFKKPPGVMSKKEFVFYSLLFLVGSYMSFVSTSPPNGKIIGYYARHIYHDLYYAVIVCWASFAALTLSTYIILYQAGLAPDVSSDE